MSSSESSDEAPEEVTFNESKLNIKLKEKKQKQALLDQQKKTKQQRRERDQRLKEQQQSHKHKLLSEILKDVEEDNSEDEEAFSQIAAMAVKQSPQLVAPKKKTFVEQDGLRIQVLDKPTRVTKKKRLPPAGSDAVKRREAFLFRESLLRK